MKNVYNYCNANLILLYYKFKTLTITSTIIDNAIQNSLANFYFFASMEG